MGLLAVASVGLPGAVALFAANAAHQASLSSGPGPNAPPLSLQARAELDRMATIAIFAGTGALLAAMAPAARKPVLIGSLLGTAAFAWVASHAVNL